MSRRAIVRLIYKCGVVQDVECKRFNVTKRGGQLVRIEWEEARPDPMFLGVDEIAAVYLIRGN